MEDWKVMGSISPWMTSVVTNAAIIGAAPSTLRDSDSKPGIGDVNGTGGIFEMGTETGLVTDAAIGAAEAGIGECSLPSPED